MVWRHVVERDGFGRGFDERSSKRGAEIGRLRSKEGGMNTEWTTLRSNIQRHCGCKVGGIGSGESVRQLQYLQHPLRKYRTEAPQLVYQSTCMAVVG